MVINNVWINEEKKIGETFRKGFLMSSLVFISQDNMENHTYLRCNKQINMK